MNDEPRMNGAAHGDEIVSIEDALLRLRAQSRDVVSSIPPPKVPSSSAEAIAQHLNAILGRAIHDAVTRSRTLRYELEQFEESLVKNLQHSHDAILANLQHGESLMRIADFVRDERGCMAQAQEELPARN